ncbi:esterase FrsA [Vibrio sp. SM6]|uniref:Esterase FrsA n=1 Tax=Vibrio agarilyticus TaxID=2726741 RepID=A0A7X8YI08_9VIBR|nr:esterase FrsA [Vibrio agarilyticus]NLS14125.1 esterase FrsA [Vibrio agarilyticus]
MNDEISKNLSETLFVNHKQAKETSTLTRYMPSSEERLVTQREAQGQAWYRNLRRLLWTWQGVDPIEMEAVFARIASSTHSRSEEQWLDTVMGFRGGNWAFEWTRLGAKYRAESATLTNEPAAQALFQAALCYSIASYPHLRNDNLASQARILAFETYEQAAKQSPYIVKTIEVPYQNRKVLAYLHLPNTDNPKPAVLVSGGLESLQVDMWRLFHDHLAPRDFAMITVDMPSLGHSAHWPLTENSSELHQAVLCELAKLPWVDHHRVGLLGFRFGGHAMTRLAFLEQDKVKACAVLGAPVHELFVAPQRLQAMPKMYLDVLASRLGKNGVDIGSLAGQMLAWSLKLQGFLANRKTPVPILALSIEGDPVSSLSDNRMVATYSRYGRAKQIPSDNITQGYEQALDLAIKWLEDEIVA